MDDELLMVLESKRVIRNLVDYLTINDARRLIGTPRCAPSDIIVVCDRCTGWIGDGCYDCFFSGPPRPQSVHPSVDASKDACRTIVNFVSFASFAYG